MDGATFAMYLGVGVTVALSLFTVTYHVGRLSARVDSLEEWRRSLEQQFNMLHGSMRHIEGLIKGEET